MHFPSPHLTLALSIASTTLANPTRRSTNNIIYPSTTGPDGSQPTSDSTSALPADCIMFKPYVPEIVMEAVCSLHLTPSAVPTLNAAFTGGSSMGRQPSIAASVPQNTYQAATTSQGGGEYEQAATTQQGQPTMTMSAGGTQQPTGSSQGGYVQPTGSGTGFETQTIGTSA
ncbi:MAG: hypothetical protein LQ343_006000 [Gyalolechia ehrenbergii]|nr:MAG: hypothetical protein LQ343_006000 [Gyalolechia ehrenbergii]